ncbi:Mrp/NBP35 family ATP-binding protein [Ruminococcaceae bacterium OttesenSCG-928-D13]|nr:Mrp/NBP35 family ATP-binding protein [Ruminococcaceae bacterium OttesenSCG-928-D13]
MSEACDGKCDGCEVEGCAERSADSFLESPHRLSTIKRVIGVVSGKGGVGKTLVTSLLAVLMQRGGNQAAILDADVTGPSIPRAFGIKTKASANEQGLLPAKSKTGIQIMSTNLLLENETDPVVWRGPIIAGTVKQFWTDVIWTDVDYMFVDLPPGTGDVPLTVFQSIPLDGIIIVTSPQELVGMIVEKAVNMAAMMNIPVLALVENMSYFECPDCGGRHAVFGDSHVDDIAARHGIPTVCKMPINPKLAAATDAGTVELFEDDSLSGLARVLEKMEAKR